MIAIDTSVLIDLLGDDARAASAEDALRSALSRGPVVACDVVVSEVVAGLGHGSVVIDAMEEAGIAFSPVELRCAVRAGEMQRRYRQRGGPHQRSIPDFLVGAHALLQCDALITLDADFFRDYFKGLKVIVPKSI